MNVKSKKLSRRKFLKQAAAGASWSTVTAATGVATTAVALESLTGCAALDRYFEIEKFKYDREVLIFGAGVAGLTTAYYLKKNKIPYRIFEASSRTGGRVISQHSSDEGIFYDLGASRFDDYDKNVLNLIKELNLEVDERDASTFKNSFSFLHRQLLFPFKQVLSQETKSFNNWNRELIRIKKNNDEDSSDWLLSDSLAEYERISLKDILRDSKLGTQTKFLIKNWAEFYFQKSESQITFLSWLMMLEKETLESKKNRISNGMEELTINLTQRVSGVIPNYNLQLPARLLEIQRANENWLCQILTSEGIKKISSPYVVLAMPFSELKKIKGIENVFVDNDLVNLIKHTNSMSSVSAVAKFKTKIPSKKGALSEFLCIDKKTFKFKLEDSHAIFSFRNENDFDWFINEKNLALNFISSKDFNFVSSLDWGKMKFINGTKISLNPMEALKLKKSLDADWSRSSLQLVGDYIVSAFNSSLNDTIQSSLNAVENIRTQYFERIKDQA